MRADARWIMASQRHPFATSPWPARVRDFRRRLFVAEPGRFQVVVLTVRVLRSVPARFADVHGCESAALTRLCGQATRAVQGDVPHRRHEGPHNLDPFLGTATLRTIFSSRTHSVQVGSKVRFTPPRQRAALQRKLRLSRCKCCGLRARCVCATRQMGLPNPVQ